jgi:DNA-binding transcriptional LysR family regulator
LFPLRDIDLKSLRLFVAVCETGNLKSAAEQEHIEPSAVSKRLASLEAVCGAQLLVRHRNGAKPTPEGQAMLEHARSVLFTMSRAATDLAAFKKGIQGHVRLVASASAIAESLLDEVSAFMLLPEHEQIQIDIEEKISKDIIQTVRDGQAQLGICWENIDLNGLASRPYHSDELVLAVPVGHKLAQKKSIYFEESLDFSHVGLPPSTAVSTMLQRVAGKVGKRLVFRAVVSNFDSAFRVVAAGLGVSIVPREVGQIYVANHLVKTVALKDSWAHRRFVICFRSSDELTPASKSLIEFLTAKI